LEKRAVISRLENAKNSGSVNSKISDVRPEFQAVLL